MLPKKIAFVDLETTGVRSFYDRVIEIGIIRVEENKIIKKFHSLINPQTHLPPEITILTGITADELENAPTFRTIKDEILETLSDCVFVAHNVRFDFGFLRNELKRENITFSSKQFCTVRLSRLLYPTYRHHNLDALIERFQFKCENRHRALDDAKILFQFYQTLQEQFSLEKLTAAVAKSMKKPSLPLRISQKELDRLPEQPGVYIFYGEKGMPLYIGKSKNIKNRVLSHFSADIHSPTEMRISQQIESIETVQTVGELGALFLESQMIKKMLPLYNKKSRIKRELIGIKSKINEQGYQEVYLQPITTILPHEAKTFLGFSRSRKQAKALLADLAKQYGLCEKLLGLEKTAKACFAYRLKRCGGACVDEEKPLLYNMKCSNAFAATKILTWPFSNPILIEEQEFANSKEYFLVDQWCYLGSIRVDNEGIKKSSLVDTSVFDLDVYQILKQYLKDSQNYKKVRLLQPNQISSFFDNQPIED